VPGDAALDLQLAQATVDRKGEFIWRRCRQADLGLECAPGIAGALRLTQLSIYFPWAMI
jgi:hypothetical protein